MKTPQLTDDEVKHVQEVYAQASGFELCSDCDIMKFERSVFAITPGSPRKHILDIFRIFAEARGKEIARFAPRNPIEVWCLPRIEDVETGQRGVLEHGWREKIVGPLYR